MLLSANILSPEAVLNSFEHIGTLEFIAGSSFRLVMQLKQAQREDELRYVVPSPTAPAETIVTIHLPKKDGSFLDKVCDFIVDDRSIWYCDVTAEESEELISGNFTFDVDVLGDGTIIYKGYVQNGLSLVNTGGCC